MRVGLALSGRSRVPLCSSKFLQYAKPIIFGDVIEGGLLGGSFGALQCQLAPESSILTGLMMQKDIGLHWIDLVVIVVVIHEVIHIP